MHKILFLSTLTFLLFTVSTSFGFPTKGQECTKCHTLKKDEALSLLKNFDQNIKITDIKQSPAKYLWEVSFETGGKKGVLYIDLPKKNLISGSIIEIKGKKNITQNRLSELNKVNVSQIPLNDALILGDSKAKHRVIVFDDPE
jgi:thiol:disulfide interchange protein DsbC